MRELEAVEHVSVAALEAASAESVAEEIATLKLRNADLQRRLDATLEALDKARAQAPEWEFTAGKNHQHQLAAVKKADEARRIAGLALKQVETYQDAVKMLVERGAISPIEVAQLNLGTYIPGDKQSGLAPTVEFGTVVEGKASIDFGQKSQATEAKYRILKGHFQAYQVAIGIMLDRLNDLSKSNHVTKEDLRKLRGLREELSIQIKRTI